MRDEERRLEKTENKRGLELEEETAKEWIKGKGKGRKEAQAESRSKELGRGKGAKCQDLGSGVVGKQVRGAADMREGEGRRRDDRGGVYGGFMGGVRVQSGRWTL